MDYPYALAPYPDYRGLLTMPYLSSGAPYCGVGSIQPVLNSAQAIPPYGQASYSNTSGNPMDFNSTLPGFDQNHNGLLEQYITFNSDSPEQAENSSGSDGSGDAKKSKKDPFDPECSIPLPFQLGEDYNYMQGISSIYKRNERERHRVRCVNDGYETLRQHLPLSERYRDKRLSKVETLRLSIRYIRHLELMLSDENHWRDCRCKLKPKQSEVRTKDGKLMEERDDSDFEF